jgi:alkylation response protein AidB-like acyl-CoA dehydrogenase
MLAKSPDRLLEYLGAIARLAPLIAEHRETFDQERRLPDTVFQALADAGLFRLWLPEALGGPELPPSEFMKVVEAVSALDGSVGWLVGNGAGMSRIGGYLPEAVAKDLFADPRAYVVSATGAIGAAQRADGGYRITGRWPFGSGAHHATRFMGLASLKGPDGGDEPLRCFYFDRGDVLVHDTWRVSGLRATGSCDFEVSDLFVPESHTHLFMGHKATQAGGVYRLPVLSAFAWTVSVVPLGIARGAMDAFAELVTRKTRAGTSAPLCDREIVQAGFGRAEALHRSGRAFLLDAMAELMAAQLQEGEQLVRARAMFRVACTHAAESAVRIVDMLAADAGAIAIFETSSLERFVRDIHAAIKHIAMSPNNYTVAGRLGFGLEPGTLRF